MTYLATFYSHFGALRFKKLCQQRQFPAQLMPVPRDLSSSCGSCIRYEGETPCPAPAYPEEVEQVVQVTTNGYRPIYRAKDS